MKLVAMSDQDAFFADVNAACKQAVWAALATLSGEQPRVRMVHPTWEGRVLWLATGTGTPKHVQLEKNPSVDLQYQVSPPDFVHVMVRGRAAIVADAAEKTRVWDVIDYDLAQFWPGGFEDPGYTLVRIDPTRVELSKMFGTTDKRIWRAPPPSDVDRAG